VVARFAFGGTQADAAGKRSPVVGPVAGKPILFYSVAQPVNDPPTPITRLNDGMPPAVVGRPLRLFRGRLRPWTRPTGPNGGTFMPVPVHLAPFHPRYPTAPPSGHRRPPR
jgi:hypothetical protein